MFWVELSAQTGCCHVRSDIIKSEYSPARQWGLQPALECLITAPFNSAQDGGSHSSKLLQKYNASILVKHVLILSLHYIIL